MALKHALADVSSMRVGAQTVNQVYLGANQVWPGLTITPNGSYKNANNGVGISQQFTVSGGNGTQQWSVTGAGLTLTGATLATCTVSATGRTNTSISGTLTCVSGGVTVSVPIEWSWGTGV